MCNHAWLDDECLQCGNKCVCVCLCVLPSPREGPWRTRQGGEKVPFSKAPAKGWQVHNFGAGECMSFCLLPSPRKSPRRTGR